MNSATYLVSPGALGNSAAGPGDAHTRPLPSANADIAREFLNKSRRFIFEYLQDPRIAGCFFAAVGARPAKGACTASATTIPSPGTSRSQQTSWKIVSSPSLHDKCGFAPHTHAVILTFVHSRRQA